MRDLIVPSIHIKDADIRERAFVSLGLCCSIARVYTFHLAIYIEIDLHHSRNVRWARSTSSRTRSSALLTRWSQACTRSSSICWWSTITLSRNPFLKRSASRSLDCALEISHALIANNFVRLRKLQINFWLRGWNRRKTLRSLLLCALESRNWFSLVSRGILMWVASVNLRS